MIVADVLDAHSRWTEAAQSAVSRNIAFVDVPQARTARAASFADVLGGTGIPSADLVATHPRHIAPPTSVDDVAVREREGAPVLQDEMVELARVRRAHDLNVALTGAMHRLAMSVREG